MDFDRFDELCGRINETDTRVLFCERFDEKSDIWNFSVHKHDCIELLYFLCGGAVVKTNDSSVNATLYDVVVYPKDTYHTELLQYNSRQEVICLWVDMPGLDLPNVIRIQDTDARLKVLLENIHGEYKSESPCMPLIENYVKSVAMLIARRCASKSQDSDIVSRVIMYLRDHASEKISIQQLADMAYVSKSYLSRIFKRKTGMAIIEYLTAIRIEAAKVILVSTEMSTAEISYAVGYSSPKYFSRAFLACTGMSPREFKKRENKRNEPDERQNSAII